MRWILASASPRRKELLAELIDEFEIIPSLADENLEGDYTPTELVKALAERKASMCLMATTASTASGGLRPAEGMVSVPSTSIM